MKDNSQKLDINQEPNQTEQIENDVKSTNNDSTTFAPSAKPAFKKQFSPAGFEEKVVEVKRISKTTKGGRHMRFSALVVIGNKNGQIGFGMGKSIEVPDAIRKALKNANNNIFQVRMNKNGTVFHENIGKHGASRVLVKPAPKGTGIIAGGPVRAVIELAGYNDIYTKSLGSSTPINVIRGTVKALCQQYTPSEIASLRDKNISEL